MNFYPSIHEQKSVCDNTSSTINRDHADSGRIRASFSQKSCCFVPCPSRLARLRAPPSLSLLSSSCFSSACDERISCEDDFRAEMEVRVLFEGEYRIATKRKWKHTSQGKKERNRAEVKGKDGSKMKKNKKTLTVWGLTQNETWLDLN